MKTALLLKDDFSWPKIVFVVVSYLTISFDARRKPKQNVNRLYRKSSSTSVLKVR